MLGSSGEGVYIEQNVSRWAYLFLHNMDNLVNDYPTDHLCKKKNQPPNKKIICHVVSFFLYSSNPSCNQKDRRSQ